MTRRIPMLAAATCLMACGPDGPVQHPVDPNKPIEWVLMEPVVLQAKAGEGGTIEVEAYDAALLFDQGLERYETGEYAAALGIFARLLEEFPGSQLVPSATFNLALCLEKSGEVEKAAAVYASIVETYPGSPSVLDAMFRRGYCLEHLGLLSEAIAEYERVLGLSDLSGPDTVEAMARIGHAQIELGMDDEAEGTLELAVSYFVKQSEIERFDSTYYAAQAQFELGEISRVRFESVAFTTDEAEIREALDEKLAHLVEARDAYVQTIKIGNFWWAGAAGFRVGELFRTLYDDVVDAPVPPEVAADKEMVEIYFQLLDEKVMPLLESSISIWEKTLLMAERIGLEGEWVEKTDAALAETRQLLATKLGKQSEPGGGDQAPFTGDGEGSDGT